MKHISTLAKAVESLTYMLLHCDIYKNICSIYIDPTFKKFQGCVDEKALQHLLNGENEQCAIQTAVYIKLTIQYCRTHPPHS